MVLFGFRDRQDTVAGIDLGGDAVRIVQLDRTTTPYTVVQCVSLPWPERERIVPGVTDPATLGSLIAQMLDTRGIELSKVSCALASPSVFTKRIKTPALEWKDLKAHVELESLAVIPASAGGVQIDFHPLRRVGKEQLEVLLVAAKQEAIEMLRRTMAAADLEVAVLDVDSFATENAFEVALPDRVGQTVAIVNIGAGFSTISVRTGGISSYAGDIPLGVSTVIDSLSDSTGVSLSEAYRLILHPAKARGETPDSLSFVLNQTVSEISRRLSLFWTVAEVDRPFEGIVLCGEGGSIIGLRELLAEKTGVPVEVLDPLSVFYVPDNLTIDGHPSDYTIATGLALRTADDRITDVGRGI